jgi:hypothetical protein
LGSFKRIRVSSCESNRHPDFMLFGGKYQCASGISENKNHPFLRLPVTYT